MRFSTRVTVEPDPTQLHAGRPPRPAVVLSPEVSLPVRPRPLRLRSSRLRSSRPRPLPPRPLPLRPLRLRPSRLRPSRPRPLRPRPSPPRPSPPRPSRLRPLQPRPLPLRPSRLRPSRLRPSRPRPLPPRPSPPRPSRLRPLQPRPLPLRPSRLRPSRLRPSRPRPSPPRPSRPRPSRPRPSRPRPLRASTFAASTFAASTFAASTFAASTFAASTFAASTFSASTRAASTFAASTFAASTLCSVDLCSFDLCGFDLRRFDLCGLHLCHLDLRRLDLRRLDLRGFDLRGLDLCSLDLFRLNPCGLNLCGLDLCRFDLRGFDLCGLDLRGLDLCGVGLCGLQPRVLGLRRVLTGGVLPRRFQLLRLPSPVLLGRIELGRFNGALLRPLVDWRPRCIAISKRLRRGLRDRHVWRYPVEGRWRRWGGGHEPRGLVAPLQGDHGRRGYRRGRRVAGSIAAEGHLRRGWDGRGVCGWFGLCRRIGLRHGRCWSPLRSRRAGRGWLQRRSAGNRLLGQCLLQRLRDRRDRRLRGGDLRRNDYDAQIGYLDPSVLPGEGEARKPNLPRVAGAREPKSLATKGQAQQHRVDQQRKQERQRQSPALRAHALAVGASLEAQACSAIAARALLVRGRVQCCARESTRQANRSRPCQNTSETFVSRIRSIVICTSVRRDNSHMSERTVDTARIIAHGIYAPINRGTKSGGLCAPKRNSGYGRGRGLRRVLPFRQARRSLAGRGLTWVK